MIETKPDDVRTAACFRVVSDEPIEHSRHPWSASADRVYECLGYASPARAQKLEADNHAMSEQLLGMGDAHRSAMIANAELKGAIEKQTRNVTLLTKKGLAQSIRLGTLRGKCGEAWRILDAWSKHRGEAPDVTVISHSNLRHVAKKLETALADALPKVEFMHDPDPKPDRKPCSECGCTIGGHHTSCSKSEPEYNPQACGMCHGRGADEGITRCPECGEGR